MSPDFHTFVRDQLGTSSWAVFRNRRHRNAALYDHPPTMGEYEALKDAWIKPGGDPEDVGRRPGIGAGRT